MYSDTLIVVIFSHNHDNCWPCIQDLLSQAGQAEVEQAENEGRTEAAGRPHEPCDQVDVQ